MDSPSKLRTAHQVAVSASAVPAALAAAAAAATTTSGLSLTRQPPPPTSYGSSAFAAAAAAAAAGGAHRGAAGPPPPPQHSSEQIAAAVRYYSAAAGSAAAAQHPHSREPAYIRAAQVRFLCLLLRPDEWGDRIDIPQLDRSPWGFGYKTFRGTGFSGNCRKYLAPSIYPGRAPICKIIAWNGFYAHFATHFRARPSLSTFLLFNICHRRNMERAILRSQCAYCTWEGGGTGSGTAR